MSRGDRTSTLGQGIATEGYELCAQTAPWVMPSIAALGWGWRWRAQ